VISLPLIKGAKATKDFTKEPFPPKKIPLIDQLLDRRKKLTSIISLQELWIANKTA